MNYSNKKLDIIITRLALIIYYACTPLIFYLADVMRSRPGTGGELLYPLLPILYVVISNLVKEEEEEEVEDDNN